ncbi:MAG: hypothetical protein ABS77_13395 [Phenylobacterium sp. SCN 69-14]|nr:MAG: hypothetical protein ABS77_13395 [Phenylobacterium sp. SCN 69-14]
MAGTPDHAAIRPLPLRSIQVSERLRAVDPAAVANLQTSIEETGWFGSILVRPLPDDELGPRYELIAGAHRLAAMKALGRRAVPATIRVMTDDEARQVEIDENLVRRGLTPLERAEMVALRFELWRRRFPERVATTDDGAAPKRGRPGNSVKLTEFIGGAPQAMGFSEETAAEIGISTATVERAFRIVRNLPADLRARLHGTPIARNEGLLRQLAAMGDKAEQAKVSALLIAGEAKSVPEGMALASGNTPVRASQTPVDLVLKAFRSVWGNATPEARAAILRDLAGRSLPKGWSVSEVADG